MKDNTILLHYLTRWFNEFGKQNKNWAKNSVGKYLKQQLTQLGHWKNKPRGKSFTCKKDKKAPVTPQTDSFADLLDDF